MQTSTYTARDIGYGIETGEVILPACSLPDWTGKREYVTTAGETVYLFDDELDDERDCRFCGAYITRGLDHAWLDAGAWPCPLSSDHRHQPFVQEGAMGH